MSEDFTVVLPSTASKSEFPDNSSNSYKVRLPYQIRLKGEWKVALKSISLPDARLDMARVFGADPMFKLGFQFRIGSGGTSYTSDEIVFDHTDCTDYPLATGKSFMNCMLAYLANRKSHIYGEHDSPRRNRNYADSNGKHMYWKFKWDGDDLVTDNQNIRPNSDIYFKVHRQFAERMHWVEVSGSDYKLGPNLRPEFYTELIPDINANGVIEDVQLAGSSRGVFWTLLGDYYQFSFHCNWRFSNLNVAFGDMVDGRAATLFVYTDACKSSIIGGQITDFIGEVPFKPTGDGNHFYEPLNLSYIPVQRQTMDTVEVQIATETGPLASFGQGNTSLKLAFKQVKE